MKKLITVLLTAMLLIASSAYATGTLADAYKASASKNYAEEIKIYKALALKGDAEGQFFYGEMHEYGKGTIQDYAEAAKWYRLAAEQTGYGGLLARFRMGEIYIDGHGVAKDLVKAHMWFNLSTQGPGVAMIRDRLAEEMTQQQIAQAQKLARECLARKYKGC